ncbi:MAG: YHS domain-containing protein [Thermoplasmata archaeon]
MGPNMATDPVCGMSVDEGTTDYTATHEGRTFYFCSSGCKETFEADPHRYGHPD